MEYFYKFCGKLAKISKVLNHMGFQHANLADKIDHHKLQRLQSLSNHPEVIAHLEQRSLMDWRNTVMYCQGGKHAWIVWW